jgi:hypothetical protein
VTLKDVRDAYEAFSGKASDIVRQLALAGIGIAWLFRSTSAGADRVDPKLINASFFIVIALGLDLLQYLVATTIWLCYFRYKERHGAKLDTEFDAPPSFSWPSYTFFYLKSVALLIAYGAYIIPYLWWKFVH